MYILYTTYLPTVNGNQLNKILIFDLSYGVIVKIILFKPKLILNAIDIFAVLTLQLRE